MEPSWWEMPGPARLIDLVVGDLSQGNNAVLCVPSIVKAGVRDALVHRASADGLTGWYTLDSEDVAQPPFDCLFAHCAREVPSHKVRNIDLLVAQPDFQGRLFWLELDSLPNWLPWREFLE